LLSSRESFLSYGIAAGFAEQNRHRSDGESHKTLFERFIFQTYIFLKIVCF